MLRFESYVYSLDASPFVRYEFAYSPELIILLSIISTEKKFQFS